MTTHLDQNLQRSKSELKGEDRVMFDWIAPEYIQHQKSARWYQIAGTIVGLSIIWAFWAGNWSMAIAIIALAFVYQYLHTYHPPQNIKIIVSELGIRVGKNFYPYSHIQAFWILYGHRSRTLNLRVASSFFYDICIQLSEQDPVSLRQFLVGQVPEWEGKTERLGDEFLRLLKL